MIAFLALVRKDMLLFFRDKRTMVMSFAAPIVLASFFSFVFRPRSGEEVSKTPVAWVEEDQGPVAQAIHKKLTEDSLLELKPMSRAEAEKAVHGGKISAAVILPAGFGDQAGRALFRRDLEKPKLEVLYDPSRRFELQMVQGILTGRIMEAVSSEAFGGNSAPARLQEALTALDDPGAPKGKLGEDLRATLKSLIDVQKSGGAASGGSGFGGMTVPFKTEAKALTGPGTQEFNAGHSFAGMGVQFVLFFGIETGVALLLQKQRGLWRRFRAAPISRATLLGARAVSAVISTLMILAALFTFARFVFGSRIGNFGGFALVCLAIAIMTAGFGLLVAALGKTPEGTRPISILATLVLVMLGGSWIPTSFFPDWMQQLTLVTPTRWAVDGLDAMSWRGLEFGDALLPVTVLVGFGIAFMVVAWTQFQVEMD